MRKSADVNWKMCITVYAEAQEDDEAFNARSMLKRGGGLVRGGQGRVEEEGHGGAE